MNILAAFDQGQTPAIVLVDKTSQKLDLTNLQGALNRYLIRDFIPVWGTPCQLSVSVTGKIPVDAWAIVFLDDADAANALGYHDLTPAGFPLGKVFVETLKRAGESVSVTASHELVEMLVDPGAQLAAIGPNNTWYAYEVGDPCQGESYEVDGVEMTDFVYPSWFEGFRTSGKFDQLGKIHRPFQILKGGYMPVYRRGRWSQIFGSIEAEDKYEAKPHPRIWLRKNTEAIPSNEEIVTEC